MFWGHTTVLRLTGEKRMTAWKHEASKRIPNRPREVSSRNVREKEKCLITTAPLDNHIFGRQRKTETQWGGGGEKSRIGGKKACVIPSEKGRPPGYGDAPLLQPAVKIKKKKKGSNVAFGEWQSGRSDIQKDDIGGMNLMAGGKKEKRGH